MKDHAYRSTQTKAGPRKQRKPAGVHTISKSRVGGKKLTNKTGKAAKKGD